MKMKRYRIKENTTVADILATGAREGGSWINKESKYFINHPCYYKKNRFEFDIGVAFKENVTDWNDFDNVIVLDEDFCQPYTPFYGDNYGKDITGFDTLIYCIEQYNAFLDSLPFIEEIKEGD